MNVVEMVNRFIKQLIRAYQIPSGDGSLEAYRSAAKFVLSLLHGKTYAGTPIISKAIEKPEILAQLPGGKARFETTLFGKIHMLTGVSFHTRSLDTKLHNNMDNVDDTGPYPMGWSSASLSRRAVR